MKKVILFLVIALAYPCSSFSQDKKFPTEKKLLKLPEEKINTLEGALIIMTRGLYPKLDLGGYMNRIDAMAGELKEELKDVKEPEEIIRSINNYIFEKKGFKHEKEVNLLHEVLNRRCGGSFGLCALYLSITERLGLKFYAVSCPRHVFLRFASSKKKINIELKENGKPHPDEWYIKEYNIPETSRTKKVYLENLTKREVLGFFFHIRGLHRYKKRRLTRAIKDYSKAIKLNPKFPTFYLDRGTAYATKEKMPEAISDFSKVISLNPKYAKAYVLRGVCHGYLGDFRQAFNDCNKGIELNPKDPMSYTDRGMVYLFKKDLRRAIQDFTKAISLDPKFALPYFNRGICYKELRRRKEARRDLKKYLELEPKGEHAEGCKRLIKELGK